MSPDSPQSPSETGARPARGSFLAPMPTTSGRAPASDGWRSAHRHGPRVGRGAAWGLAVLVPLAFLGVFFALPVGTLVVRGFVADGALDLSGFAEVFGRPRTWRIIGLTV